MDWTRLHHHGLAVERAFEVLCTHLFERWLRREKGEALVRFYAVDGCGGDGGVEAFGVLASGDEVGLQCKWFPDRFRADEAKKLDDSVRTARERHPRLIEYVVAFPKNLKDAKRNTGDKSELDRWKEFARGYPGMVVTRWDEHQLEALLLRDQDLRDHWFGDGLMVPPAKRLALALPQFEGRYAPTDPHVPGQIRDAVALHLRVADAVERETKRIGELSASADHFRQVLAALIDYGPLRVVEAGDERAEVNAFVERASGILNMLRRAWSGGAAPVAEALVPPDSFDRLIGRLSPSSAARAPGDPMKPERERLQALPDWVDAINTAISRWRRTREMLVVVGPPGCGKTHGLVATGGWYATERDAPTYLLAARHVDPRRPWQAILGELLDRPGLSVEGALAAMESEAHAAMARRRHREGAAAEGARALLIVDGLDESRPADPIWRVRLAELRHHLRSHPALVVAVSVRSSAVERCLPTGESFDRLDLRPTGDADLLKVVQRTCEHHQIEVADPIQLAGLLQSPLAVRFFAALHRRSRVVPAQVASTLPHLIGQWLDRLEHELQADDPEWPKGERLIRGLLSAMLSQIVVAGEPVIRERIIQAMMEASPPGALSRARAHRVIEVCQTYALLDEIEELRRDPLKDATFVLDLGDQVFADYLAGREAALRTRDQLAAEGEASCPHILRQRPDAAVFATLFLMDEGILVINDEIWTDESLGRRFALLLRAAAWAAPDRVEGLRAVLDRALRDNKVTCHRVGSTLVVPVCRVEAHPFGAAWLHEQLTSMTCQERDVLWSAPTSLPTRHSARWEGWSQLASDALTLWPGEPWWGAPRVLAWTLTSLDRGRVAHGRSQLARWARSDLAQLRALLSALEAVDDPQVQEELALCTMEAVLWWEGPPTSLDALARYIAGRVFGGAGATGVTNVRLRVAARAVVELAAARVPDFPPEMLERARPPYPVPDVLLPVDRGAIQEVLDKPSTPTVAMLDWDLWHYVVGGPINDLVRTTDEAGEARARVEWSDNDIKENLRALVRSGAVSLTAEARRRLIASWDLREAEIKADRDRRHARIEELVMRFAARRGEPHAESAGGGSNIALSELLPAATDTCWSALDPLVSRYAAELGIPDLTVHALAAGIAVSHLRRHGWGEDAHRLDRAIHERHSPATHGSRSEIAGVAEKYAFTAAHEIAGHFLLWRPPARGRQGRSSGQVAEYAVSSDLLIGVPCRENAPPVERLWATWAPDIGPPGVTDDGDAGLARVTRRLLSAAFPDPGSLLAGPEPGSVVIACATVDDSLGATPRPALWISALALPADQIDILERDLRAGLELSGDPHEQHEESDASYLPSDLVAVSTWILLRAGWLSYVSVDSQGRPCEVVLQSLSARLLDHDGENELHTFLPGGLLREHLPVVTTRGDDRQRHFLDPQGRTRAVAQRSPGRWREPVSTEALFADRANLLATLRAHGLEVVWAVRQFWEVPPRLWVPKGGPQGPEDYPAVRDREQRAVLRWVEEEGWRVLCRQEHSG